MAEREGFEPSVPEDRHTAFRERHLQPLGHLSRSDLLYQIADNHLSRFDGSRNNMLVMVELPLLLK
jgi:hypothetical protein